MLESTDSAFLRTILQQPDHDAPRLIYADYLDEHGDSERAEFIRLQCELAENLSFTPRYRHLKVREQELLAKFQVEWKNQLPILKGVHWESFERGFVACVRVEDPYLFFSHASEIFEATPIQRLSLHGVLMTEARRLAKFPELQWVRTLDLEDGNRIGNAGLEAIAESPHLTRLCHFKLRNNVIAPAGVRALAHSEIVKPLLTLDLDHNHIYEEGVMALAESPHLQNLALLSLGWTRTGNQGVNALTRSPYLNRLASLYLTGNEIDDEGVMALAGATHWTRLRELWISDNRVSDPGIQALANSSILEHVRCLYLKNNRIGDAGAVALAESPYLEHVNELILGENRISAEAGQILRDRFGKRVWLW